MKLRHVFFGSVLLSTIFVHSNTWAQDDDSFSQGDEPRFQATANAADTITPIGGKGVFGVGFYSETIYLLSRPFSSVKGANPNAAREDMRFQIPLGFGIEGSYGISRHMEAALSVGLDYFKTQNFRDEDLILGTKIYDEVKYRLYPVMGLFRYRWPRKFWAPEAEVGLGAAMGTIEIRATTQNKETIKQSGPFFRGHLAAGAAFSWGEGASLHVQLGYAANQLGSKVYEYSNSGGSNGYSVEQKGMMSGVFTKAALKFYF